MSVDEQTPKHHLAGEQVLLGYSQTAAEKYHKHHSEGIERRFSNWLEVRAARKCLQKVGNPASVLDMPCGAGRFWPMLAEKADRRLMAGDYNVEMINTATSVQPAEVVKRFEVFQGSAFELELPDASVECILSMRFVHHLPESAQRLKLLREFHRVAQKSVVLSLWVDGNYKAWQHERMVDRRGTRGKSHSRFVISRKVLEQEFHEAGFHIVDHIDLVPGFLMWRFYALEKR